MGVLIIGIVVYFGLSFLMKESPDNKAINEEYLFFQELQKRQHEIEQNSDQGDNDGY